MVDPNAPLHDTVDPNDLLGHEATYGVYSGDEELRGVQGCYAN